VRLPYIPSLARTRLANQQEDYNWVRDRGEALLEPPIRYRLVRSSTPKQRGFTVVDTMGCSTQARRRLDSSAFTLMEESFQLSLTSSLQDSLINVDTAIRIAASRKRDGTKNNTPPP
jgi:hypothetical protein